jgi:predicted nucleic acid-binding protein
VALADEIPHGSRIAFDTNAVIYFIEEHAEFLPVVRPVFALLADGQATGAISVVTLLEVLVRPLRLNLHDLAQRYRDVLTRNLAISALDVMISERAASLRAAQRLAVVDAVVAATALECGCTHLVTNDPAFRNVDGMRILMIGEFV